MTKDRIQIDGTWYVREYTATSPVVKVEPIDFQGCVVENEHVVFEATRTLDTDGTPYGGITIKFTDKRFPRPWKEEEWDNPRFLRAILVDDPEAIGELHNFSAEDIDFLQKFLRSLLEKKWL
tara:strand:- start:1490 stop:1855 length:366 start_codon:yes stop_codon:yes gene_type:complete